MEKVVESLGILSLSKSKVAVMADDLDAKVEAFRSRPWIPATQFVAADALGAQGPGERAGWSTCTHWSRPGSTPRATGRSSKSWALVIAWCFIE